MQTRRDFVSTTAMAAAAVLVSPVVSACSNALAPKRDYVFPVITVDRDTTVWNALVAAGWNPKDSSGPFKTISGEPIAGNLIVEIDGKRPSAANEGWCLDIGAHFAGGAVGNMTVPRGATIGIWVGRRE